MKKIKLVICILIMLVSKAVFADDFIDFIHGLAIYSACSGQYSATQYGGSPSEDPEDYYKPQLIAEFFAEMSGERTKTDTFYGICFDYANHAYEFIEKYSDEDDFSPGGMRQNQFFIAVSADDPNIIELSTPVSAEEGVKKWNGVFVKTNGSDSYKNIESHSKGHHAWLWIQRYDGVWFWVDPTWTDNCGFVVYGYVGNGREIQCYPYSDWCVEYPSELNQLPFPPIEGNGITGDKDPVLVDDLGYIRNGESCYWEFTVPKGSGGIVIDCATDVMLNNMSFAVVSSEDDIVKFINNCLGNKEGFHYIPGSYKTDVKNYSMSFNTLKPGKTYYFCAFKKEALFVISSSYGKTIITW